MTCVAAGAKARSFADIAPISFDNGVLQIREKAYFEVARTRKAESRDLSWSLFGSHCASLWFVGGLNIEKTHHRTRQFGIRDDADILENSRYASSVTGDENSRVSSVTFGILKVSGKPA